MLGQSQRRLVMIRCYVIQMLDTANTPPLHNAAIYENSFSFSIQSLLFPELNFCYFFGCAGGSFSAVIPDAHSATPWLYFSSFRSLHRRL